MGNVNMFSLENLILKEERFGALDLLSQENSFHIAFGVDENFIRPMGVAITSIILNNEDEPLVFHLFLNAISKEDHDRLKKLADTDNVLLCIYMIDHAAFPPLQTTWNYTLATYNRFIVAKYLRTKIKRILYLDADIVCKGKIAELKQMDFEKNIAIVVHDQGKFIKTYLEKMNLTCGKYFNAGMLYIDLIAWNDEKISERAIELLQKEKFFLLDQDALNILLDGKAKFVDKKWNAICNMEKKYSKISDQDILVHFASRNKPWHIWCIHPEKALFLNYSNRSLWADVPMIDHPRSYKEMKMMGAAMLHAKRYKQSLYWYWKYWNARKKEK